MRATKLSSIRRAMGRIAGSFDVQRAGNALSGPGVDTRGWLHAGTVGVFNEDGDFDPEDPEAVYADRLGAVADVQLEPTGIKVTARWNGVGCGRYGSILFPSRAGDQVVVAVPDGDFNSPSITIVSVMSDRTALIPEDWANDRVLFDLNVPLEIRGPAVTIRSPNLQLNGRLVNAGSENI